MRIFLKLNRWIYIVPFAFCFISVSPIKEIFTITGSLLILLWMFAVSTYGQLQLNDENLPSGNIKVFKLNFALFPILVLSNYFFGEWLLNVKSTSRVIIFVLLVLLIIFSGFYLYYFTAKTITTMDKKRKVSFSECYSNFVLIGFFGFGIFFLQPKIQKLLKIDNSK